LFCGTREDPLVIPATGHNGPEKNRPNVRASLAIPSVWGN
jgi:hypothetical protein